MLLHIKFLFWLFYSDTTYWALPELVPVGLVSAFFPLSSSCCGDEHQELNFSKSVSAYLQGKWLSPSRAVAFDWSTTAVCCWSSNRCDVASGFVGQAGTVKTVFDKPRGLPYNAFRCTYGYWAFHVLHCLLHCFALWVCQHHEPSLVAGSPRASLLPF